MPKYNIKLIIFKLSEFISVILSLYDCIYETLDPHIIR